MPKSRQPLSNFGQGVKRYETEKKISTDTLMKGNKLPCMQNANTGRTSYSLAEEYGVNPSTIQRDAQFSQVVDILPEETKHNVLSGKENITRNEAKAVIKMDKPTQKKFLKEVESGAPIKEAVKKL